MSESPENLPTCGLVDSGHHPVALREVTIKTRAAAFHAQVQLTQRFENAEDTDIEAVYIFPLPDDAAISSFQATIGDRTIVAELMERDKAFATYDDALEADNSAFLLEQERPNIFTVSVGRIAPGQSVTIQLEYLVDMRPDDGAFYFVFPTTIAPRYVPKHQATTAVVGQRDEERIRPSYESKQTPRFQLAIDFTHPDRISEVESPSHPIRTKHEDDGVVIELAREDAALDRDVVIRVKPRKLDTSFARVQYNAKDSAFYAQLGWTIPAPEKNITDAREVIFVVDCSGSMGGRKIEEARRALLLCIRALLPDDRFQIIRFGSRYSMLWDAPRAFDESSLKEATEMLEDLDADFGGTEMLAPLQEALKIHGKEERPRAVILLTDGQVSNETEIFELCRSHADTTQIFTFGIGSAVSRYLVRGIAREGRGVADFISPGERIEPKVLRMMARFRKPLYSELRLECGDLRVSTAPTELAPAFADEPYCVYAKLDATLDDLTKRDATLTLVEGDRRYPIQISPNIDPNGPASKSSDKHGQLAQFWARTRIRELEDRIDRKTGSQQTRGASMERKREEIRRIALEFGLLSSETSFVAVYERPSEKPGKGDMKLRRVPLVMPQDESTGPWNRPPGFAPMAVMGAAPAAFGYAAQPTMMRGAMPPGAEMGSMELGTPAGSVPPPSAHDASMPSSMHRNRSPQGRSRATAKKRSTAKASGDALFDLLMQQRADGHFDWTSQLEEHLVAQAKSQLGDVLNNSNETAIATTLVLLVLEHQFAQRAAEWRAAAQKARQWLDSHPTTGSRDELVNLLK